MNNLGIHWLQIDASKYSDPSVTAHSFMEEGQQLDKFAQVLSNIQSLSNNAPFRPEWMFNKELPEEIKLYLRNIFMQKIQPISFGVDVSQLSDDDLIQFSPHDGETLGAYSQRVVEFTNSLKEGAQ